MWLSEIDKPISVSVGFTKAVVCGDWLASFDDQILYHTHNDNILWILYTYIIHDGTDILSAHCTERVYNNIILFVRWHLHIKI